VAIFRDLKAGGGGGGGSGGASSAVRPPDSNTGASARAISPSKPPAASMQPPTQMPQVPSSHAASSYYDQNSGNKNVPFDIISQAQKLCRYANSALEHEDVATAVKNCEQVLQLLRPYNN